MSYALYAESEGYVHLVSAESVSETFRRLSEDIDSVGVTFGKLFNVYACKGGQEFPELEDLVNKYIKENQ